MVTLYGDPVPLIVLILREEPFLNIKKSSTTEENVLQARAFAELISHIEGNVDNGIYMFRLSVCELLVLLKLSIKLG